MLVQYLLSLCVRLIPVCPSQADLISILYSQNILLSYLVDERQLLNFSWSNGVLWTTDGFPVVQYHILDLAVKCEINNHVVFKAFVIAVYSVLMCA